MILLMIVGGFVFVIFVIAVLDAFNITHILMKGRASGTIGGVFRTLQDALEPGAQKAHEWIIEEKEGKDKSQAPSSETSNCRIQD